MKAQNFDVTLTGFDAVKIEDLFSHVCDKDASGDDYDVNEALEEAAFIILGDLGFLVRHLLLCDNATKPECVENSWMVRRLI